MTARLVAALVLVAAAGCRCDRPPEESAIRVTSVVVAVRTANEGGWLVSWDGQRPRELTVPPDATVLDSLSAALARTHPPARTSVTLRTSRDLPAMAVEVVAEALRRRGFAGVEVVREEASSGGR